MFITVDNELNSRSFTCQWLLGYQLKSFALGLDICRYLPTLCAGQHEIQRILVRPAELASDICFSFFLYFL
jgi:hypothetical protein